MNHRKALAITGLLLMFVPLVFVSALQRADGNGGPSQPTRGKPAAVRKTAASPAARRPVSFDIAPETNVVDSYPTWNGVAVDPENNVVAFSDLNRHGYRSRH